MQSKEEFQKELEEIKAEVGSIMREKEGIYRRIKAAEIELGQLEIRHQTLRYRRGNVKAALYQFKQE